MMTLWCIFGSPLMLGAEMTMLDEWTLSLLQKEELLRLENGSFVSRQVLRDDDKCVWASVVPKTGEHYIALFNLRDEPQQICVYLDECSAMFPDGYVTGSAEEMKEVWSGNILRIGNAALQAEVPPHGVLLLHAM